MKHELQQYGLCLKSKNISKFTLGPASFILAMFYIPILLFNIFMGMLLLSLYLFTYFYSRNETDEYNRGLLSFGIFLLFFGIECSVATLINYNVSVFLFTTIIIMTFCYEIIWLLKIKKKMYSNPISINNRFANIVLVILGGNGVWLGRVIARSEQTDFVLYLIIALCSIFIVGSISYFQKYLINKIINKKTVK